jgi:hypothetical protein
VVNLRYQYGRDTLRYAHSPGRKVTKQTPYDDVSPDLFYYLITEQLLAGQSMRQAYSQPEQQVVVCLLVSKLNRVFGIPS